MGMDELLYCATVIGVGVEDQLMPLRSFPETVNSVPQTPPVLRGQRLLELPTFSAHAALQRETSRIEVNCNATANEAIVQDAVVAPTIELHSHLHINEAARWQLATTHKYQGRGCQRRTHD